jgi:hypothetical protein
MDGNVKLISLSIDELVSTFLREADMAVFVHPDRNCLYKEAEVCKKLRLDEATKIQTQINKYKKEGMPAGAGLFECTILLRRHTEAVKRFNEMWWSEISNGSKRDQISFPYVLKKSNVKLVNLPHDLRKTILFNKVGTHKNRR